jgi:hypothetical protein
MPVALAAWDSRTADMQGIFHSQMQAAQAALARAARLAVAACRFATHLAASLMGNQPLATALVALVVTGSMAAAQ